MGFLSQIRRKAGQNARLRRWVGPSWALALEAGWRLRSVIRSRKPVSAAFRGGPSLMVPEGQIATMVWKGAFERAERDFVVTVTRPGMRVVNAGANAGLYTLIASRLVGANGKVYAYEPAKENFDRLQRNLAINGCNNVIATRIALSSGEGRLALFADAKYPQLDGHFSCRPYDGCPPEESLDVVECDSLDRQLSTAGQEVDLLIIDVEGAEEGVLAGAAEVLRRSPQLLIMVECTVALEASLALLREAGLVTGRWDERRKRIIPSLPTKGTLYACRSDSVWQAEKAR